MFRILGEGEPETLAEPHRLPKDSALALKTSAPLTQRGNTLSPLRSSRSTDPSAGLDRSSGDAIAAYQPQDSPTRHAMRSPRESPDRSAALVARGLQQQMAALDHQVASGVDEVSQLRQHHMLAARDAAASKAQMHALMEVVHGLQQSAADSQVRSARRHHSVHQPSDRHQHSGPLPGPLFIHAY